MLKTDRQEFKIIMLASILLAWQLFIFSPSLILFQNIHETFLSLTVLLIYGVSFFVGTVCLLLVLWYLLPQKLNQFLPPCISAIAILAIMQGSILLADFGPLDGAKLDFSAYKVREILEIILWVSMILTFIVYYEKFKPFLAKILFALFSFQLLLLGWQGISVKSTINFSTEDLYKKEDSNARAFDPAYYELSSERNIIHIVPDSYQSNVFEELVMENPDYQDQLQGFSFFKNHMGLFPTTHLTIPVMMSGEVYDGNSTFQQIWENIADNNLQQKLVETGYRSDMKRVQQHVCLTDYSNCFKYTKPTNKDEYYQLIDHGLFRTMPNVIKRLIYNNDYWLLLNYLTDTNSYKFQQSSEAIFFKDFTENLSVSDTTTPMYKFFHLIPPHIPYRLDSECNLVNQRAISKAAQKDQSHCVTRLMLGLVQKLKELDIYDKTMIVISSDHGFRGSRYMFAPRYKYQHPAIAGHYNQMIASSMALLLVKPFADENNFKIVDTHTSIQDIPNTILDAAGSTLLAKGTPIFTIDPEEVRTREFNFYLRGVRFDDIPPLIKFTVSGPPMDPNSWRFHDIDRELVDNVAFRDLIIETPAKRKKNNSTFKLTEYRDYFTFGWDVTGKVLNDGQSAIWSLGKASTILMALPEESLIMTTELRSFPFKDPQHIKVFFNDKEIGSWDNIDSESFHEYSIVIPSGKKPDISQIRFEYKYVYEIDPEDPQGKKPVAIALSNLRFKPYNPQL